MNHIKKLYRSRKNRIIAGVCGGLAEYFKVDTTIVRVIFVATLLIHGLGGFIYLVFWILTPQGPEEEEGERDKNTKEFIDDLERELQAIKEKIRQRKARMEGVSGSKSST